MIISGKAKKRPPHKTIAEVFQLEVKLDGVKPAVWRRIAVSSEITLLRVHKILQVVMGWADSHLHQFIINDQHYSIPYEDKGPGEIDERHIKLNRVIHKVGETFKYVYDFGDDWVHIIRVEQIGAPDPNIRYPHCSAGKRACPPEDVGGPFGYKEFLEALADSNHEDYQRFLGWIGGHFDPNEFDIDEINESLRTKRL